MKNYYEVLEIKTTAKADEIKKAYRLLAKRYHPDSNPGDKISEAKFKEINKAYETLSNEARKIDYDRNFINPNSNTQTDSQNRVDSSVSHTHRNPDPKSFSRSSDAFENFFGFNPKSKEVTINKDGASMNAMKTKDAFDAIFNRNKK